MPPGPGPRAVLAALATVVLAGCSGGGASGADDDAALTGSDAATGTGGLANGTLPPTPVELPVAWEGRLIDGAWYCEGIVFGDCGAAPSDAAFGVDHAIGGATGNVTGTLELAWTASNAVTDQLVIDASVLTPGCDDCPFESVGHTAGLSPLSLELDAQVPAGAVLRLSVYVDKYVSHPLATVGASGDQEFSVTGTLSVLP